MIECWTGDWSVNVYKWQIRLLCSRGELLLMIGWLVATATILPVLAIITRMGKLLLQNIYIIYYNITYLLHTYSAGHIFIKLIKNSS